MSSPSSRSERIVIVGGGFAGLAAAARLAQAGLPVTVLEASKVGSDASTHNQGWLHSGAWFAGAHPELARMCHDSLQQTIAYCPDCVEQRMDSMVYLSLSDESDPEVWKRAWDNAGIPWQPLSNSERAQLFPEMRRAESGWAMRLPDRSFRPDVLLSQLAATARNAGAEVRTGTAVTGLLIDDNRVHGVAIGAAETMAARLVILAAGAQTAACFSQLYQSLAGRQSDTQLVCLKTHLRAIRPGLAGDPFCVVDGPGFNHLPHSGTSVFGTNRWIVVSGASSNDVDPGEIAIIEEELGRLFPEGLGRDVQTTDWAGITVQAMQVDQIQPGDAPLPTIIDHAREPCGLQNVLSIFPGRATLWAQLAERVRVAVLEGMDSHAVETARPPWVAAP